MIPEATPRRFTGDELIVASHNSGKVHEIVALLRPYVKHFHAAADLGLPEPDETESTFIGNAELKARAAAVKGGMPALADDSGLVVPALGGAPGIYSARWAGPERDFDAAMERVVAELGDKDSAAYFVCALSLGWPDGHCETVEGKVFGRLVWPARGAKGFGYDPIFVADGHTQTFGEISPAAKHAISHRADAFRQLTARCFPHA
jgi:XTP/dITP diphosphohydrolase